MSLEFGDDFFRPLLLRRQLRQLQYDAERNGVEVGVNKPSAVHTRCATKNFNVNTLIVTNSETLVNDALRKRQGFFHAQCVVAGIDRCVETSIFGNEAIDAITSNNNRGSEVSVGTICGDSVDAPLCIAQQTGHSC